MDNNHITVIGSGAWGTALAVIINRTGADVALWGRNEVLMQSIISERMNTQYLPDVFIEPAIDVTSDMSVVSQSKSIILAVPAQTVRTTCITLADMIDTDVDIIVAAKGVERGSLALMSEIVESILPYNPLAILSGPNFADEAAKGKPTATVLACRNEAVRDRLQFTMGGKLFRPYATDDVISVQIGGAVKNIIALACGMADGAGMGENARAALITRGLVEMQRLAEVKGGDPATLNGLAGMGDLILSCTSTRSRNMAFGRKIGQMHLTDDISELTSARLAEGVMTAEAVYEISLKQGIRMPICVMVANILKGNLTLEHGIDELLSRPIGME